MSPFSNGRSSISSIAFTQQLWLDDHELSVLHEAAQTSTARSEIAFQMSKDSANRIVVGAWACVISSKSSSSPFHGCADRCQRKCCSLGPFFPSASGSAKTRLNGFFDRDAFFFIPHLGDVQQAQEHQIGDLFDHGQRICDAARVELQPQVGRSCF